MNTRPNYGENTANPTREVLKMRALIWPGHPYYDTELSDLRVSEIVRGDYITIALYRTVTGCHVIREACCDNGGPRVMSARETVLRWYDDPWAEFRHRFAVLFLFTREACARSFNIIPEVQK